MNAMQRKRTGTSQMMSSDYVLYDGACRVCSRDIAATGPAGCRDIALIDIRNAAGLVTEHDAAGRKIDHGMVVAIDGIIHFGSHATRKLAEIGRPATPAQLPAVVRWRGALGRRALSGSCRRPARPAAPARWAAENP